MTEYTQYYNRIVGHKGVILEARENFFIVWKNPTGTVIRADYFDGNGNFEGREIISRP